MNDEIEFHLEMQTRRYIDAGLDPVAARAKALERMGDILAAAQQTRAITISMETTVQKTPWLQSLSQDVRYAVRVLRRTPLFTATALVTLAIGIGATTAIFTVVNAVLLRDLPYPNADRILVFYDEYPKSSGQPSTAPEEFADVRSQSQAFEHVAAIRPQLSALTDDCVSSTGTGGCEPERVSAYAVSPELFDVLGVLPARGRPFAPSDGVAGAARVVLLTDALWQRRYGSDPSIVGRTINLAGIPRTVIGVMPPGIRFPDEPVGSLTDRADIWIPFSWENIKDGRGNQYLFTMGSVRPGVSLTQAQADLQRVGEDFKTRFPDRYAEPNVTWRLGSQSLTEQMIGDVRLGLIVLFGAVGCVLLIACANVANLMLARGASRRRELAVRSALGANRRRLVQQLLVETLVLTTIGTVIGLGVAALSLKVLLALNPGSIPRLDMARIDGTVLLFASVLALVTGVVVGLIPAWRQAHTDPQVALGDGARGTDTASPRRRLRGLLVMTEVAMAVVVLTAAALLIRSFIAMAGVPVGVTADGVAMARLSIPRATYNEPAKVFAFHQAMRERLAALPGVTHASAVYPLPMSGNGWGGSVGIVGRPLVAGEPEPHAEYAVALPGYFATAGIPLVEGRDFNEGDRAGAPLAVVVDTEFARQFWPGESAVGKRIATNGNTEAGPFQTVIGVVGHVRNKGARVAGEGQLYLAALQKQEFSLFFVARTEGDASALLPSMRAAVREQDARLPVAALSTMDEVLAKFTARERFNTLLFTIFGLVALGIASIGLYGVLAFLVTQRTREIGIRLALGGHPSDLVRMVMFEGLALTVAGLAAGLAGAFLLSRWLKDLLFEVEPTDPITYATIAGVMLLVAVLAAFGPARRATKVEAGSILR
jgi:putative ABC transport system permease protein